MTILNTTYYVHETVDAEVRRWVTDVYFPSALNIGGLVKPVFARISMPPQEGMSGYAVQLMAENKETAELWHDNHAADLRAKLSGLMGEKMLFFTTYMEILNP